MDSFMDHQTFMVIACIFFVVVIYLLSKIVKKGVHPENMCTEYLLKEINMLKKVLRDDFKEIESLKNRLSEKEKSRKS